MEQVLKMKEQTKSIIKIDELGRIHIPIQVRDMLHIQENILTFSLEDGSR